MLRLRLEADLLRLWFIGTLLQGTKISEEYLAAPAKADHVTELPWQAEPDAQPDVAQRLMHEQPHTSWLWQTKLADAVEVFCWQLPSKSS